KENADEDLQPRLIVSAGLPPVIEAEDFANSSGVSVLPSSDVGGGSMVEFSAAGNSASYDVRVAEAGTYLAAFRVASESGSVNLELAQDGTPITTLHRFVGSGETWTTIYKMVTLQAGFTTLTVSATDGNVQFLNWFELSASNKYFEDSVTEPVNVALNQSASASSVHSSPYTADKAVDGDLNTRWASSVLTPWMEVDFGETVQVNGSRIVETRDRIRSYEILAYNGTWETAFTGGNPNDAQTEQFPPVTGTKFRLQIMSATANPTIEEWELYGGAIDLSASMVMTPDSITLDWPNYPGDTYAVQRSTNLVTDAFSTTVESGIPALTQTNSITIEIPEEPASFFRIIAE
ncbi:discoidin domain-containing protein, partial [Pontiellaceae bacterium B12219]|nr:discoidin domain-containing protein [Pontiellaceae bacterium B12219]